jgi:FlaA1/EpsC-like NDP-sugar epimerase
MRHFLTRSSQVMVDLAVLASAYCLAYILRFEGWPKLWMFKRLILSWPYVVVLQYLVLMAFGVPRFAWSYVGLREVRRILYAIGLSAGVLFAIRYASTKIAPTYYFAEYAYLAGGVIIIDFALAVLGIAGVRVARRILAEHHSRRAVRTSRTIVEHPTLLLGAGQAGVSIAREISKHPELGIRPVGFLDDDLLKVGTEIEGLSVLGSIAKVGEIARHTGAQQALITIASATGSDIRRIQQLCADEGLTVKIVPGLYDILHGKVKLSRIRDVSIDDLLGRDEVHLETELIERCLRGKRVLVTGAGGSIGSELCRQVARFSPESIILVERAEYHLFLIHEELLRSDPRSSIVPCMADVCDRERLDAVLAQHRPHVIFHAAAHKHVPLMEWNAGEAVKNNVFGTKQVADAADRHGVETFVLISTDKAVNPSSVMGATKRVAEMYVQALSQRSQTKYVAVRFGNVLGSTGSVIPTFKAQIARGGPVMVTHPEMKRYFMTIPEASQLVTQAAAMGNGGEIFVLDMGEPVRIVDLARDLIRLSGFEVDTDIKIEFSGVRPGEKLFEELGFDAERMRRTRHPKIFEGTMAPIAWDRLTHAMGLLEAVTGTAAASEVRRTLQVVVPEMIPGAPPNAAASVEPPPIAEAPGGAPLRIPPEPALGAAH